MNETILYISKSEQEYTKFSEISSIKAESRAKGMYSGMKNTIF